MTTNKDIDYVLNLFPTAEAVCMIAESGNYWAIVIEGQPDHPLGQGDDEADAWAAARERASDNLAQIRTNALAAIASGCGQLSGLSVALSHAALERDYPEVNRLIAQFELVMGKVTRARDSIAAHAWEMDHTTLPGAVGHNTCRHLVPYSEGCPLCNEEVLPDGDDGYGRGESIDHGDPGEFADYDESAGVPG